MELDQEMKLNEKFEMEVRVDKGIAEEVKGVLDRGIAVEFKRIGGIYIKEGEVRRPASLGKIIPQNYVREGAWQLPGGKERNLRSQIIINHTPQQLHQSAANTFTNSGEGFRKSFQLR
jgi:hypothetical protein